MISISKKVDTGAIDMKKDPESMSKKELEKMVQEITKVWLETPFEGGRHERRIEKIPCK